MLSVSFRIFSCPIARAEAFTYSSRGCPIYTVVLYNILYVEEDDRDQAEVITTPTRSLDLS